MPKLFYTEIAYPDVVRKSIALANGLDFPLHQEAVRSALKLNLPRVFRKLAAGKPGGRIGEAGTGSGVGTAWLARRTNRAGRPDSGRVMASGLGK
jgi:hypothetical protein